MSITLSTTQHPILDRTPKFRAAVDRLQLDCLDRVWLGPNTPLRFVCSKGHLVLKSPAQLRQIDNPCGECVRDRFTERLREVARDAGVIWLNERWLGSLCYHYFCCKHGHSWQRQGSKAIARCACPTCAHTEKSQLKSLRSLRTIAVRHGGRCLSLSFESSHQRYCFCCAEGHTFELVGSTALRGSWCRQCANNSKMSTRMSELRAVCAEREGVCLSDTHASFSGLQRFRCQVGHEWDALPSSVLRGSWCRRCIIAKTRTLEAAQQQARYYGGQCLSLVYGGAQEKLQWTCGFGHFWSATLAIVRGGSWCRECRKSTRSSLKRLARFRSQNTPDS